MMKWSELNLEAGVWELPPSRTKAARGHRVFLPQLARQDTFRGAAEAYMLEHGRHLKSGVELQRKLDRLILPVIGHIPAVDLTRGDIKDLFLRKAEDTPVAANRMLALINVIMNYCLDEGLIQASPTARIKMRPETPRARYLKNEEEIRRFWLGLDAAPFDETIKRVLRLLLVLGQRRGETALMKWSELNLEAGVWELPPSRTKAARGHRVFLPQLALGLIGSPNGHEYVFCNAAGQPLNLSSIGQSLYRNREALGLTDLRPHDLRRSFATQLGDLGVDQIVIGKILNHAEQGVTATTYALSSYADRKAIAMEAWSNKLHEIVSGKASPSNVTAIRGAVG